MKVSNCSERATVEPKPVVYNFDEITRQEGVYVLCDIDGDNPDKNVRFIVVKADNIFATLWYNKLSKQLQPALNRVYGDCYFKKIDATVRFEIEE